MRLFVKHRLKDYAVKLQISAVELKGRLRVSILYTDVDTALGGITNQSINYLFVSDQWSTSKKKKEIDSKNR